MFVDIAADHQILVCKEKKMKKTKTCIVVFALLSFVLASLPVAAQTTAPAPQTVAKGTNLPRASKLIGTDVENAKGENLGKIEDVVLDPQDGRVAYAVLSFGGFLGLGEKYFAIPWSALTAKAGEDDTLILNVDQEKLKNAPGFNKSSWPNMADRTWGKEIHSYYGVAPYWESRHAARQDAPAATARPSSGMMASDAVPATVVNVNQATKSLQLQTTDGKTVELKVPEMLSGQLHAGDRVEVVIRKQGAR
jgi:sporulation protein YlmC with PRC-barrel domain